MRGDEKGQMAFLLMPSLPGVFILMVLSVDAGVWFFDHRTAQDQVDPAEATAAMNPWLEQKSAAPPEDLRGARGNSDNPFAPQIIALTR